jgi:transposase
MAMSPVDRSDPQRAAYSESSYSLMEFMREFPDDAACLDWLWRNRCAPDGHHAECPKCERERKFHKVNGRPAWDCDSCGYHLHPLAGTIFHKSSTSLHLWFFAMHLMASTRCGISAKQLERELGVTYKTAWRMFNLIRNKIMVEDDDKLSGHVEADEASVDGKPRVHLTRREAMRLRERSRASVFAAVERGGRIKATVLPSRRGPALRAKLVEWVHPEAIVYTDDWPAYNRLGEHFAASSGRWRLVELGVASHEILEGRSCRHRPSLRQREA